MKIAYFTHSLLSCWNHGNAHFVRGVLDDLASRGHEVVALEHEGAWSLANLLADHGEEGLAAFRASYPRLKPTVYRDRANLPSLVGDADVVIAHEWNEPDLIARLGQMRAQGGRFTLLFHDTHHRAVSAPDELARFALVHYDGVLAFGEALSAVYRRLGWGRRVWTWHEAADVRRFHPPAHEGPRAGLVWIGNWGDGERTGELRRFLFGPARGAGLPLDVFGVRYPETVRAALAREGVSYRGWAANAEVPALFARYLATAHVPRRYYAETLPGIPTIRMFEALACGIPLASAPWSDAEALFRTGDDYLVARDGDEMRRHLSALSADADLRAALAANGRETILARHTCAHRVDELLGILTELGSPAPQEIEA